MRVNMYLTMCGYVNQSLTVLPLIRAVHRDCRDLQGVLGTLFAKEAHRFCHVMLRSKYAIHSFMAAGYSNSNNYFAGTIFVSDFSRYEE